MVDGSFDTGGHIKDSDGHYRVPLGLGGPEATLGVSVDHVVVGVVVGT